jgi:hypothetical protein
MSTMNQVNTAHAAIDLTKMIRLEHRDIYCLPDGALSIRVLSGRAWVTSQAKDHFLGTGDMLSIPRQPHTVIISALDQSLIFELHKI